MNFKEHLSEETLKSLLKNELPEEMRGAIRLHLSYCPICREQKDDLALQFASLRMWEAYQRSGHHGDAHIEDETFRDFWLGELRDRELIKQLSRHCLVCRDCRVRRELARAEMEKESTRTFAALLLTVGKKVWRRRLYVVGVGATLLLAFLIIQFFPAQQTLKQVSPTEVKTDLAITSRQELTRNDNSPQVTLTPKPSVGSPSETGTQRGRNTPPQDEAPHDLLTQAQTIDLARAPDGADSRSPDGAEDGAKNSFKIVASRSRLTHLRISLPANSKSGVYYVSIHDPAFLDELVRAKGRSRDGVTLPVSINMQGLRANTYVLRITRRDPKSGSNEYIGDYHVLVTRTVSASGRLIDETPASEK